MSSPGARNSSTSSTLPLPAGGEQQPRAVFIHVIAIGARGQQPARGIGRTRRDGDAQRRDAADGARVHACMRIQQSLHHFGMAAGGAVHQRGDTLLADGIDIGAKLQRLLHLQDLAPARGLQQVAVRIGSRRLRGQSPRSARRTRHAALVFASRHELHSDGHQHQLLQRFANSMVLAVSSAARPKPHFSGDSPTTCASSTCPCSFNSRSTTTIPSTASFLARSG